MPHEVVYHPETRQDLKGILDYLTPRAGAVIANKVVAEIVAYGDGFDLFPERGTRHDELEPGLRTVGFKKRRTTILFRVDNRRKQVHITGVYYGGRDYTQRFRDGAGLDDDDT